MSDVVPAEFQNAPPWLVWEEASVILPLTKGYCTIIDAADWPIVQQANHTFAKTTRSKRYAYLAYPGKVSSPKSLHRSIMGNPQGLCIDHVNGDALDNRRHNLRSCTLSQNNANRRRKVGTHTPYKGVTRHKKKFRARIKPLGVGRYTSLGLFKTAEAAALAYNEAALKHFGEFAYLNVIHPAQEANPPTVQRNGGGCPHAG